MSTNKNTATTLATFSVVSSYAKEILTQNHYAKIHSVFPNGFNLNFNGKLVYMSPYQEGQLSALGLAINKEAFNQLIPHLKEGLHVRVRGKQLMFYTRPHIYTVDFIDENVKNLQVIPVSKNNLEQIEFERHLADLNLLERSGFSTNEMLKTILEDIKHLNEVEKHHVKRLIGAGIGLTPTGDDFLQGLIFMEKTFKDLPYIQTLVQQELTKRSTTDISLSYYEALFAGYSNEPLVILFEAIKKRDNKIFMQALDYIQDYGSTSGYDLLIGIETYFQII